MIKYIIDKNVDLECEDSDKWRPIHFICNFSTPEMIKYIIDKHVELECETIYKWRPIHFICKYSTLKMLKYIVDRGVATNTHTLMYNGEVAYTPFDIINKRFKNDANVNLDDYINVLIKNLR
jgi:ankyrin repeat protein